MANTQINISTNGTTTLATAGKYCDRNIDVNVEVAGGSGFWDADTVKAVMDKTVTSVAIPDGTENISRYAFCYCEELASVNLPDSITNIDVHAFNSCGKLVLTSLPSNLTIIGANAFVNCNRLSEITIPSGVTSIGNLAFYGCFDLASVTFEGTPTKMGTSIFSECLNLKTINVPWAEGAVSGAPWGATKATINYNYTGE